MKKQLASTTKKAYKKGDKIHANGRNWSEEAYKEFRKYQTKFNKDSYRMYGFRVRRKQGQHTGPAKPEVIEWLDNQTDLNNYLLNLIESDMKEHAM